MIKSPFSARQPKDFRILMLYPNLHMSALMPQVIGIFTALFKREGYTIDLFDCTYFLVTGKEGSIMTLRNPTTSRRDIKRFLRVDHASERAA